MSQVHRIPQSQNNFYKIAQKKQQLYNSSKAKKFEKLAVYSLCKVSAIIMH